MKPKFIFFLTLLTLTIVHFHCAKEDGPTPQSETGPMLSFFDEAGIFVDTTESSGTIWDYGFEFNPLKSGKITQLGIKVPKPGDYEIVLWDLSGPTPVKLRSEIITISASEIHNPKYVAVNAVSVANGARLVVSILSSPYYRITKLSGDDFTFPREVGNLRIVSFLESLNTSGNATVPQTKNKKRVAPCVNVIFIAD